MDIVVPGFSVSPAGIILLAMPSRNFMIIAVCFALAAMPVIGLRSEARGSDDDAYGAACRMAHENRSAAAQKMFLANAARSADVDAKVKNLLCAGDMSRKLFQAMAAEAAYRKALELCEQKYGQASGQLLPCLDLLAKAQLMQGQVAPAQETCTRLLKILETVVGPQSDVLLSTLELMSQGYEFLARYDQAEAVQRRILAIRQQGKDYRTNVNTPLCMSDIAHFCLRQGKLGQAKKLLDEAVRLVEEQGRGDSLQGMQVKTVMVACLVRMRKKDEAQPLLNEIKQWCSVDQGGNRNSLVAGTLSRADVTGPAIPFAEATIQLCRKNKVNKLLTAGSMEMLVVLLEKQGELARAEKVLHELVEYARGVPEAEGRSLIGLARFYIDYAKTPKAAIPYLRQSMALRSQVADEKDPVLSSIRQQLIEAERSVQADSAR